MSVWRDDVVQALREIGGVGDLDAIYTSIRNVRQVLPKTWQAIVRRELEQNSSDTTSFQKRYDLFYSVEGVGSGVWGVRENQAIDIAGAGRKEVRRNLIVTNRIIRDSALSRRIKILHDHKCQLCGFALPVANRQVYSEAHHIKPLGGEHNGPDISENIIVLCPNHHAQCDFGAIRLDLTSIRTHPDHRIAEEFIDYHNEQIVKS